MDSRQRRAVDERDGDAHGHALLQGAHQAGCGRAVQVELVADTPVGGGDHDRAVVGLDAHVGHERGVEHGVHRREVVGAPLGEPLERGPHGRHSVAIFVMVRIYVHTSIILAVRADGQGDCGGRRTGGGRPGSRYRATACRRYATSRPASASRPTPSPRPTARSAGGASSPVGGGRARASTAGPTLPSRHARAATGGPRPDRRQPRPRAAAPAHPGAAPPLPEAVTYGDTHADRADLLELPPGRLSAPTASRPMVSSWCRVRSTGSSACCSRTCGPATGWPSRTRGHARSFDLLAALGLVRGAHGDRRRRAPARVTRRGRRRRGTQAVVITHGARTPPARPSPPTRPRPGPAPGPGQPPPRARHRGRPRRAHRRDPGPHRHPRPAGAAR